MKTAIAIIIAMVLFGLGYGTSLLTRPKISTAATESSKASTAATAPKEALPVDSVRFDAGAAQLTSIRVEPVIEATVPLAEPLNARLAYNENATARIASPVAGRVTSLKIQPGDAVKTGDPLLVIDSPELAKAVADFQLSVSDETRKRLTFERTQKLVQAEVAPRKDLEAAKADFDAARAESQRAQRRLRNLSPKGADGSAYTLRSPIAGVVVERRVNQGSEVRPDLPEPLFTITDPLRLWVIVDLPERDLALVRVGHHALVQVDGYAGEKFNATIERIGEIVDPSTRRIQVRAALDNSARKLKPEMYARVILVADDAPQAVRVPNSALVTQGLYSYVFVEASPGLFKRRQISLTVQDREFAYVTGGLVRGERLVTAGALLLNSELATSSK